jgi:hypothetical protein
VAARVDVGVGLSWGLLAATMTFEKENSSPEEAMTAKERVLLMKASVLSRLLRCD